jgi:hypothetical protein
MRKKYTKPELIDLNEQTGLGGIDCVGGSGASGGCCTGNIAIFFCNQGTSGNR